MGNILEILKRTKDGMLNSLRKKGDTSLFNKPLNELEKLGIPAIEREKIVSELLSEGKTASLVNIRIEILDQTIDAQVRLSLTKKDDGELGVKVHFVRNDLASDLNQSFMGHHFTDTQKQNLLIDRNAGEVIQVTNSAGKVIDVLISVDRFTGELVSKSVKDIVIPDQYNGIRLSDSNKEELRTGLPVVIESEKELCSYSMVIQYSVDSKRLEANIGKIKIGGSLLSNEDTKALQQGKTIQISNLIDSKGEKYTAHVTQDKQGKLVITPALKHEIQIRHNNNGEKTEINKRKEKKQGESIIKSGTVSTKRKELKV